MSETNRIDCPNCGERIDVNELLYHQLQEEAKQEYGQKLAEQQKQFAEKEAAMKVERDQLAESRKALEEDIREGVNRRVKEERAEIESRLRKQIGEEQSEQLNTLNEELQRKSDQLKEYNKAKAEIEKLKREKLEMKDEIEAEAQKQLNETLAAERAKILKSTEEKVELKLVEKDQLIQQLKDNLKEAQRKAEQGSMQAQGEAQELAIEDYLKEQFPLDTIDEIKKGVRGADCLQVVNTRTAQNCGTIYYESKRTKSFQPTWIPKFRDDMRDKGANVGVLVTDALPSDMERMGLREGVWICTFSEFKGLCHVLRESIIQISNAVSSQENRGDKMAMLYDFLTGNEFKLQVEAIVEGFTQMKEDLDREKRSIQGHWKRREKQIEKVLLNTNFMYNSIKGIAGSAIQDVPALELGEEEEEG